MKRRILPVAVLVVAGVIVAAGVFAFRSPPQALKSWVAGPAFNAMLSRAVSHALKVEGKFGPMALEHDWTVVAENFTSKGWPGQAIGSLDSGRSRGSFDVWGLLRGEWRVPLIGIERADFRLVPPDDALKARDPVIPPKPWYAFMLPSRFSCGWIDCPDTSIELPLGAMSVRGEGLHFGATMIGKNFKYSGRGGLFLYPEYPPMAVDAVEVYVTREMIDIGNLALRETGSDRSNLQLSARLGQHADKSIKASAQIDGLDIVPFLPADVAKVLSGRLNGRIYYATDSSGKNAKGGGAVSLAGGELRNWDYLDQLAERAREPEFAHLQIGEASVSYTLDDDVIRVDNLGVCVGRSVTVAGRGSWHMHTSDATLALEVFGVPLGAYLPPKIAGSLSGTLGGTVEWSWRGTDIAIGTGGGTVRIEGAKLSGFQFQEFLDRFLKTRDYSVLDLAEAGCRWRQDATGLYLDNVHILAPGRAGLRGSLHIAPDGTLSGTILAGLPESALRWLPDATKTVFSRFEDGLHWCSVKVSGTEHKPVTDFTAQVLRQLEKHPAAMADLVARGISWWLGDILHTPAAMGED